VTITIEIPVATDGELSKTEQRKFKDYLQAAVSQVMREQFGAGARMYGTVCRFAFSTPTVTIAARSTQEGEG
jgi:hypothetical protein